MSFKYPGSGNHFVLQDLSLKIPFGSTTAFVGSSGSGKSTIVKLIANFYTPQVGSIQVGTLPLCQIKDTDWASRVSVVLQNGKIFSGTILSNIAFADECPNKDRVREACRIACIDDFVSTLPLGINSRIGKTGLDISGGQQQRILIARAVYRKPQILILDEATSSLDAVTEAKIMENIFESFKGKTLVIAAHRLSTIKNAEKICVIDNGKIKESGTHEELIAKKGKYYELVDKQF